MSALLALVPPVEFAFLLPLCVAISLVSSVAHREDMRLILRLAARSMLTMFGGLLAFMVAISYLFEWILP